MSISPLVTAWRDLKGPIGLFGGTFDPIQNAHLAIAQACLASGRVETVVFIPTIINPHKHLEPGASGVARTAMIEGAIGSFSGMYVSDIELKRALNTPSYTFDTVTEIKSQTTSQLYFIMGSDCLDRFGQWHRVHELIDLLDGFIIYPRPNHPISTQILTQQGLAETQATKVTSTPLEGVRYEIAAREIRSRVQRGEAISELVPSSVDRYIRNHGLYR